MISDFINDRAFFVENYVMPIKFDDVSAKIDLYDTAGKQKRNNRGIIYFPLKVKYSSNFDVYTCMRSRGIRSPSMYNISQHRRIFTCIQLR